MIPRQGGKSRLANKLVPLFPSRKMYAEPFGGAAWVLLNKNESLIEIFNDIDSEVTNLFRIIRDFPGEFINRLRYNLIARETFDMYKKTYMTTSCPFDRAVMYYYVYCNSFSCDMTSFIKRDRLTNPNRFGTRLPKLVTAFADRMANVVIENLDFREFFNKYNGKEWFYYIDPPYYGVEGYSHPFVEKDHIDLAEILNRNNEILFLLSYNDTPEVRTLYKNFNINTIDTIYQAANRPGAKTHARKRDLVITNYELELKS